MSVISKSMCAGIVLLGLALSVSAQDASPAPSASPAASASASQDDRTLVVSADRVAEDAAKTAANVTVIDQKDIQESGASSLPQVLDKLAGVQFRGYSSSPAEAQITMRGFGDNSFGRVLVLVDGLRLNNPDMKGINWLSVSLGAIDRIEVLHGPAASLYGDSAVAGVINIITKEGAGSAGKDGKPAVSLSAALGNDWTSQQNFSLSQKAGDLSYNLGVQNFSTEGYRNRTAYRSTNADGSLKLDLGDRLSLSLGGNYADSYYQMPGALSREQFASDPHQANNLSDEAREQDVNGNFKALWDPLDELNLVLPVNYRYAQVYNDMVSWSSIQTRWTNVVEARPQANLSLDLGDVVLKAQGGFDFGYTDLSWTKYTSTARTVSSGDGVVQKTTGAPWAQFKAGLFDLVNLEAGARYDTASYVLNGQSKSQDAFVWDASVTFVPAKQFKVWAGYDSVFRYPFTDELASVYSDTVWDLKPETGYNLEGGIGLSLDKKVLDVQASVYYLSLENEIAWVNDYSNFTDWGYNTNLDATKRIGVDASVSSQPVDFLSLQANYSFVDARFAAGTNEGKEIPLVSAHKVGAQVDFKLPFGLSIGPRGTYVSDFWASGDSANAGTKEPGYFLLGADASLDIPVPQGKMNLRLAADNILDTSYYTLAYTSAYGDSVYSAEGFSLDVVLNWNY